MFATDKKFDSSAAKTANIAQIITMPFLEQIWDLLGVIFGGLFGKFERAVTAIFGSANARQVTRLQKRVEGIGLLEPKYEAMSNEELAHRPNCFANDFAMARPWTMSWRMRLQFAARVASVS